MPAIITEDIRIHNSRQFIESLDETANTVVYTFIGQPSFQNANVAIDTVELYNEVWDNMIALRRIEPNEASHVIPRNDWSSGTVYDAFRDDIPLPDMFDADFVVMNDSFEVFKCLGNANGAASTVKPTTSLSATQGNTDLLADGYRWKYMYTIDVTTSTKFLTNAFVPVLADGTVQGQAINGAILHINVEAAGSGYGAPPTVTITGDGTGATATATLSGDGIGSIIITNPGSGYRHAEVTVSGNASLKAIIAPKGGHGSDPVAELGAKYVMINSKYEPTNTVYPAPMTFHQVGVIQDPFEYGTTDRLVSRSVKAYGTLTLDSSATSLSQGDVITGTVTGAKGYTLLGTGANVLYIQNNDSSGNVVANFADFTTSDSITGVGAVTTVTPPDVEKYTGQILYVDNKTPITRNPEQTESLHIVLEF